jgi:hypothetical protein
MLPNFLLLASSVFKVAGLSPGQEQVLSIYQSCAPTLPAHSCPLPGSASLSLCPDVSSSSAAGHARAVR